ncbi:[FeFe] hydrogenase H-cluster radical SAM maturase HydG [Clostridiaceae bacterium M8S5]|nr:[FeFe] hydrogenase H-cluster radical SAM maturase HydG [Clostridiaceae bacterium M8S5]
MAVMSAKSWADQVIKQDEIDRYLVDGKDFIDEQEIITKIKNNANPDKGYIRNIMDKALSIKTLSLDETAALINLKDEDLWQELYEAGNKIKKDVYDNRVVFFAPLYCSNLCVNSCKYCGFRVENSQEKRKILSMEEVRKETEALIDEGHKRLIVVYGEHPSSDIDYITETIKNIYSVQRISPKTGRPSSIRRVNVNAAPLSIADLKRLKEAGIGTFQVFQETYDRKLYRDLHPSGPKSNYRWRLYALHRAMEAGIDDFAIGALFGLNDWRFEVMGLLAHARDLERQFGIGPHTISFPRLTAASGSSISTNPKYRVSDEDFKKLVTILRLSVPYTGLIITARERAELRDDIVKVGCTQMDASTKIGIGSYSEKTSQQDKEKQQFMLGDTRSLEEVIHKLAEDGTITSFCTAGYRCGRTGDKIMDMLKECSEGKFCKLNAVLTYKEYLDDFASPETQKLGEALILKEMDEIKNNPFYTKTGLINTLDKYYDRISKGDSDLFI